MQRDVEIIALSRQTAPYCLRLAEQVFGTDSPEYRAVQNFDKERRAGFFAHIRRCIVGFIIHDNRRIDSAEILAMAVHRHDRSCGIGRELLHRLTRLGKRKTLSVRVNENTEAQEFLRSQGFKVVSIDMDTPRKYVFQKIIEPVVSKPTFTHYEKVY